MNVMVAVRSGIDNIIDSGARSWGWALGSGGSPQCCRLAAASAGILLSWMSAEKKTLLDGGVKGICR